MYEKEWPKAWVIDYYESLEGQYLRVKGFCGSPPGVIVADTLSFNAKIGVVDFWV